MAGVKSLIGIILFAFIAAHPAQVQAQRLDEDQKTFWEGLQAMGIKIDGWPKKITGFTLPSGEKIKIEEDVRQIFSSLNSNLPDSITFPLVERLEKKLEPVGQFFKQRYVKGYATTKLQIHAQIFIAGAIFHVFSGVQFSIWSHSHSYLDLVALITTAIVGATMEGLSIYWTYSNFNGKHREYFEATKQDLNSWVSNTLCPRILSTIPSGDSQ